jgi:A/G-specific adenine glycosylase
MPRKRRTAAATDGATAGQLQQASFATRLLAWHDVHGRHDLPWQHPRTPYRVWVSEVMLQQTQVATVVGYFEHFMAALPTLPALAAAELDAVLALWSGLGYYSRARNLHRAARVCVEQYGGQLPVDPVALAALPGIGRSTAAAIAAQAHGTRVAILDGNVRRVLARHAGIDGEVERRETLERLWAEADARLPETRMADYTQAIMDFGATCCRPRQPECLRCPVADDCIALATARVTELPRRRPARRTPVRQTLMLVARDAEGRLLLERRPPSGIWGGLWSLPEAADAAAAREVLAPHARIDWDAAAHLSPFTHAFTHFRLEVTPLALAAHPRDDGVSEDQLRWIKPREALSLGLPQPVRRLIAGLEASVTPLESTR